MPLLHSRCGHKAFPVFPAAGQALISCRSSLPARVRLRERQTPPILSPVSPSPAGCCPVSNSGGDTRVPSAGAMTPSGTEAPWEEAGPCGAGRSLVARPVHSSPPHPHPRVLPQVKEASPLRLGSHFHCRKCSEVTLEGSRWEQQAGDGEVGVPRLCPRHTHPPTSVCADVGLETVVIFVLLATDSTLVGPWKTGKEDTGQPASNAYNHEAPGPLATTVGNTRCVCAQECPTPCNPTDCSPPGSSVCGISQERILERVALSSPRGSFWPRDQTRASYISCTGRQVLCHCATWKVPGNTSSANRPPCSLQARGQ